MATLGRSPTGQVRRYVGKEGVITYSLRVRALGERYTVKLGDEEEGWNDRRAELELANTMAKIKAGIWEVPDPAVSTPHLQPTMHEFASMWLRRKKGEGIRPNTVDDYTWQLSKHLLPFFGRLRPSQITESTVERYIDLKIAQREEVLAARAAGLALRDTNGNPRRYLSNGSINAQLVTLGVILEGAIKRGWLVRNPAKGIRLKTRKEAGSVLEADELWSLVHAAGDIDRSIHHPITLQRAAEVRRLRDTEGMPWKEIARVLGCAQSTAIYYYRQREGAAPAHRLIRRALISTLGGAGLRVTEAADLNCGDIDLAHGKLRVVDAKTPAGVREVHLSPWLREELSDYFASFGEPPPPTAPAFPTRTGGRRDKDNIRERVLAPVLARADKMRREQNLPAIGGHVTPHTLRRTYATLLLTAGAEPQYVMAQLGHTDPTMTLRLYARVLKRHDRTEFGEAFDRLMTNALPDGTGNLSSPPTKINDLSESSHGSEALEEGQECRG